MIITHEQTIIIPATLEGARYADDFCKDLNKSSTSHKRSETTTGISITWTSSFRVEESNTDEL